MEEIRIQKILAASGLGSRRDCEKLIEAGRVRVNGQVAILGQKADPSRDKIEIDHKAVEIRPADDIYIAFYKPRKVLSDIKKIDDRKVVPDYVDVDTHLFIVGRLDYDSEGLILLTNNGEVANHLTHPRYEHEKEYHVMTAKEPDQEQLKTWRRGVVIEGGYRTRPAIVDFLPGSNRNWLRVIMKEGKKRQIREIGIALGLPVRRIIRKRIATIQLGNLKPGEWRYLKPNEIKELLRSLKDDSRN
ncbi:MAG: rRNA pseudouridine synthase [Anaerolineae bacterium]|nr:rRNA pseudouridine synthase [Anaerolineae bacterium]